MLFSKVRLIRAQTAALVLLLSFFAPAAGGASVVEDRAPAAAVSSVRIENFGCVNPNYYRGGEPGEKDYATLAALGIKTMVDLRGSDVNVNEKPLVEKAGMKYVHIPMSTRETPSATQVQEFLKVVNDPSNQPVYVHCVGGRHRTGAMTAVYRMTQDGWTPEQAFKEMKQYHFGPAFLHPELKKFVDQFLPARASATETK